VDPPGTAREIIFYWAGGVRVVKVVRVWLYIEGKRSSISGVHPHSYNPGYTCSVRHFAHPTPNFYRGSKMGQKGQRVKSAKFSPFSTQLP